MARKRKARRWQEQHLLYRIHYECVRRNPEYRRHYIRLADHPWGAEDARRFLAGEWGVHEPPNPDQHPSLAEALMREVPEGWPFETGLMPDRRLQQATSTVLSVFHSRIDTQAMAGTLTLAYVPDEDGHRPRVTALDMRWSKKDLMDSLKAWIDLFVRERAKADLKQERPETRLRVDVYTDYLHVYDLREEGDKTFRAIAKTLWPGESGELEKRARDYYKKGKALVLKPPLIPKRVLSLRSKAPLQKPRPKTDHQN